jgi:hypothetical protein
MPACIEVELLAGEPARCGHGCLNRIQVTRGFDRLADDGDFVGTTILYHDDSTWAQGAVRRRFCFQQIARCRCCDLTEM